MPTAIGTAKLTTAVPPQTASGSTARRAVRLKSSPVSAKTPSVSTTSSAKVRMAPTAKGHSKRTRMYTSIARLARNTAMTPAFASSTLTLGPTTSVRSKLAYGSTASTAALSCSTAIVCPAARQVVGRACSHLHLNAAAEVDAEVQARLEKHQHTAQHQQRQPAQTGEARLHEQEHPHESTDARIDALLSDVAAEIGANAALLDPRQRRGRSRRRTCCQTCCPTNPQRSASTCAGARISCWKSTAPSCNASACGSWATRDRQDNSYPVRNSVAGPVPGHHRGRPAQVR